MDQYKVFTLGKTFPLDGMRNLVSSLHANNQHYIVMVDPGQSKNRLKYHFRINLS
jgi:alpha-glucosidase